MPYKGRIRLAKKEEQKTFEQEVFDALDELEEAEQKIEKVKQFRPKERRNELYREQKEKS